MMKNDAAIQPGNLVGEVRIEGVGKEYEKDGQVQTILKDCALRVEKGKLTVLMGPSGCGKTVLINLIAGYEVPTSGRIYLDDAPVAGPGANRLVVFQEVALFPWMTVFDNVAFGCRVQGAPKEATKERTNLILKKVGLYEFRDKYPSQLSGGMQRRAELARAMINGPDIMILDEPFRGLDAMTRELMQEFYVGLFEESKRTNLFITHEVDEAIFLADRLVIMTYQPGKVKCEIDIDLPRPRSFEMLASKRFLEIREQVIQLLYEEAAKAFESGSKKAYDFVGALFARKDTDKTSGKSV